MAPTAGPIIVPMYCAPASIDKLRLSFDSGTLTLTSAIAAGLKPENSPASPSEIISIHGACANAAVAPTALERNSARRNIALRPTRSEIMPHTGPLIRRAMPCVVVAAANQNRASASLEAPSLRAYSGRNGHHTLNHMLVMPTAAETM